MAMNNGMVSLPFSLPNIDLPAMNLASVHLPDVTFDGIAVTALHLPTVTLPPFNPASLTKFSYLEDMLSRAGITFDDIAKLPLPDISHLSIPGLGNVGNLIGMLNPGQKKALGIIDNANELPVGPTAMTSDGSLHTMPMPSM
ncbi:hypothetical protein GGI12_006354 [Dipsacomyces acuminosporus]|nr:hypothetical protein GGI12_006354 [Dipsacomyces acuminosporus]